MRARLFPPVGMIVGFMLLMLLVSSLPPSQAASRSAGPSQSGTTVSGQVFISGAQPAMYTYVSVAPVLPNNTIDYNSSRYTFTDDTGIFTFTDVLAGDYSMDIQPYCISEVLPLIDDRFSVPNITAPVDRGPITLPPALKQISGIVALSGTPTPQSDVFVSAYNHVTSNFTCAYTDSAGAYNLGVSGGNWEVSISPKPGALWMFTQTSPVVSFVDNTIPETQTLDLTVQPTDGFLTGRVLDPSGKPLPLPAGVLTNTTAYNYSASIDVWNDENGSYNYAYLDATGTFTLPVVSGRYNASVWVSQYDYPDYASPPDRLVEVGAITLDLGDLRLETRGKRISGHVRDNQAQPIQNAYVQAYESGGRFAYDQTATDGSYELRVPDGVWNVYVYPPDASSYLDISASQVVSTTQATLYPLDFTLTQAAAQINGTLVDQQSQPVADVDAWAYARVDDPNTWDVVSVSPVISGSFLLNVPSGQLKVGVFLAPNSEYSLVGEATPAILAQRLAASQSLSTAAMAQLEQSAYEQAVTIPSAGVGPAQASKSVQLTLARTNATMSGTLRDAATNQPVINVPGVVVAAPKDANANWHWADLNSDGSYELKLTAGTWYLTYYLDSQTYDSSPVAPIAVAAIANQTVTQNLTVTRLDGVVEGTVVDDAGVALPGTYIWVRGTNFEEYALTDANGGFQVYVPLKDGASTARYTIGTAFACDAFDTCRLDAEPQTVVATPRSALGGLLIAPQAITLQARKSGPVITITGRVTGNNGQPRSGAIVNFTPTPGSFASDDTNSQGRYSLDVTFPSGTSRAYYRLEAGYWTGYAFSPFETRTGTVDIPKATSAARPSQLSIDLPPAQLGAPIDVPQRVSDIFKASDGWTYTLSDGSQVQIPANTVPITPTSQVQVVVEATPLLQPTSLYALATYYGYTITLYDASNGKQITEPLRGDALLTLRYDEATLTKHRITESQIRPASFSSNLWRPAGKFVANTQSNKVTVQTRTLGAWALVRPQIAAVIQLPIVRR